VGPVINTFSIAYISIVYFLAIKPAVCICKFTYLKAREKMKNIYLVPESTVGIFVKMY
jgi:hypothetical protein